MPVTSSELRARARQLQKKEDAEIADAYLRLLDVQDHDFTPWIAWHITKAQFLSLKSADQIRLARSLPEKEIKSYAVRELVDIMLEIADEMHV